MPTPLAALLFDMDGLLVDTEPVWTVAEVELAERLGGTWTPGLKASIVGTRLETAVPRILVGLGLVPAPDLVAQTMQDLLDRMVELYASDLVPLPGALALLTEAQAAGIPVALVSSSYRVLVQAVLDRLAPVAFDLVLAGDEVRRAKPHPEPYLTACASLGVDPAASVVLEDSPTGIASGEAAGCAVVAVPSVPGVHVPPRRRRLVTGSLLDVDLGRLRALVGEASTARVAASA